LAGIALRILSLHQALRWAGSRLGVTARAVELPIAEACIDVDTPSITRSSRRSWPAGSSR
jgi:hypothetical protein